MFIFRGLFWLAVVALLMPRGPYLGLDFDHLRQTVYGGRLPAIAANATAADLQAVIRDYRSAMLKRLGAVRGEIEADRARRGETPNIVPSIFD